MDQSERWAFMPKQALSMTHLTKWADGGFLPSNLGISFNQTQRDEIKRFAIELFMLRHGSLDVGERKIAFFKHEYPKVLHVLHDQFARDIEKAAVTDENLRELAAKVNVCIIPNSQFNSTGQRNRLFIRNTFLWSYNVANGARIIFARDINDPKNFYAVRYFSKRDRNEIPTFYQNWEEFLLEHNIDFGNFAVNDLFATSTHEHRVTNVDEVRAKEIVPWRDENNYETFESDKPIKRLKKKKSEFKIFLKSAVKFFESPDFGISNLSSMNNIFIPSGYSMYSPGPNGVSQLIYQEIKNGKGFFTIYRPDALVLGQKIHPLIARLKCAYNFSKAIAKTKYVPEDLALNILYPKIDHDSRLTVKEIGGNTALMELQILENEMLNVQRHLDEAGYQEMPQGGWRKK